MTTITKERLLTIKQWRETYGPGSNVVLPAEEAEELARIALASLEAEPVAWLLSGGGAKNNVSFDSGNAYAAQLREVTPLYAAPPAPVSVPDDYFSSLVAAARVRADKAMRKFPQPNYVLNKVAEESGEVIKAVIHFTEGREEWRNVEGEIIDNLAMLIRLVMEGDQVIGFTPPDACRAAMLQAEPVSNSDELPLDYLQGHKDGLEWAAQLAEANHPQTGDWLYDDPLELAKAIRKGPDMPEFDGPTPVTPGGWISCSDRMPEDTKMLLAFSQGEIVAAYWNWVVNPIDYKKYRAFTYLSGNILDDVTHWMPLPEPPL